MRLKLEWKKIIRCNIGRNWNSEEKIDNVRCILENKIFLKWLFLSNNGICDLLEI